MIDALVEPAFILFLTVLGGISLYYYGFRDSAFWLAPLGLIAGFCEFVILNYLQAILPVSSSPLLTVTLASVGVLLLVTMLYNKSSLPTMSQLFKFAIGLSAVFVLVIIFEKANLVKFHYDSYLYLITDRYIFNNEIDSLSNLFATKRFSSVPIIHSVAELKDRLYLRSITPLMSLAGLISLAYIVWFGFKKEISENLIATRIGIIITGLGIAALATNHSYLFHSFYINGHMFFAVLLLIVTGFGWLIAAHKVEPSQRNYLIFAQLLAIVALVLTRPEAGVIAGLAVLPQVASRSITDRHKRWLLLSLGSGVLLERLFLVSHRWQSSGLTASPILETQTAIFILLGVGAIAASFLVSRKIFKTYQIYIPRLVEAGLWLLLSAYYLRGQAAAAVIDKSFNSFYYNFVVGNGAWGVLIMALAVFVVIALLQKQISGKTILRYPLTTFIPASLIFAILRGGGYRVGNGDSFNRSIMHILFVAVLFVVVAAISGFLRHSPLLGSSRQTGD